MARQLQPTETRIDTIVSSIRELIFGRRNNVGDVILGTGATSTVVSFINCSSDCRVFLQEQNAAAVAAQARVAPADILQGSFTIRHNAAGAGAAFSFTCDGG